MPKTGCILTLTFLALVSVVFAQEERNDTWGTGRAPCMAGKAVKPAPAYLGRIEAATAEIPGRDPGPSALVFPNSVVAAGGAGLRNRTKAHIQITGLQGFSAQAALLYWAIITTGPAPSKFYTVKLTNEQTSLTASLTGTVVGTGPPPCWPGDTITVFRALVPTGASGPLGNLTAGNYTVVVPPGDTLSHPLFGDPWVGTSSPPEWEGVSLILVGSTTGLLAGTTAIYDTGIAGFTFGGGPAAFGDTLSFTLVMPPGSQTLGPTAFYNIGADGQVGTSIDANLPVAFEQTFINTTQVAGFTRTPGTAPSTLDTDSDWNGTVAGPLPQLWDTVGHSISPGVTSTLDVTFTNAKEDCLTQVATVVFIQ